MNASRRHAAEGWLSIVALSTLVLTGCSEKPADHMESAAAAKPARSSAPAEPTAAPTTTPTAAPTTTPAESKDPAPTATPAASKDATPTTAPAESKDATPTTGTAPFAGTEQFVTIDKAWTSNGRTYLAVRPAQKKVNTQFDTWEITPGSGPFTTVPVAKNAQVLLTVPVRDEVTGTSRAEPLPYSPAQLVTLINRLDPTLTGGLGYDLVIDGAGQVTGLTSLYRP